MDNSAWGDQSRDNLKKQAPTGTFPFLKTQSGVISESFAISNYLCLNFKPELLGGNNFDKAQVIQWVEFAHWEINKCQRAIIYPMFGFTEYNKPEYDLSMKDIKDYLKILNVQLADKTYLMGNAITLADLEMFGYLRFFMMFVFTEELRKNVFPNVMKWFNNIAKEENTVKVYGRTLLCKVPQKPAKFEIPKEQPKKEEPKKKKDEDDEGDDSGEDKKDKKKPKNPLDLLPPSTFNLDDFKREFLNSKDKPAVMKDFWTKFDANGYSIWFVQYQKLKTEGKELYKTENSCSFFLQKLDHFRKYSFSTYGVYGDVGDFEIRGVWMWRGTEIPEEIQTNDSFPYLTIKKLDSSNENDREYLLNYWLHITPGEVVDGMKVASVNYFK